jgi:hypothetical protein
VLAACGGVLLACGDEDGDGETGAATEDVTGMTTTSESPTTGTTTTASTSTNTADLTTEPTTDPTGAENWHCDTTNEGMLCICDTFSGQGPLESCGGGWSCCLLWADPAGDTCFCDNTDCTEGLADCPECVVVEACPP